ncbi:MAG: Rpp14/Pop5 family protein [Candidatus Aenigmatarchaeota archaeon]
MDKISKPKILPPTLRTRGRYVIFEIVSESKLSYADFSAAMWNSLLDLMGELGVSEARCWLIKNLYDDKNQRGVIKCAHDRVEHVRASLAFIHTIGDTRATVRILGVTGTIKSAQQKYLGMKSLGSFE